MDRLTRKKKITVRGMLGSPGSISVAGGTSPGSPQRSSNDYVRNDERIIGARATSRAVKATGDQKHGERERERESNVDGKREKGSKISRKVALK